MYTDKCFPTQYREMSQHNGSIITVELGDLLTTLMTMRPDHRASYGDDPMTLSRRLHVFDRDVGDIEGDL